MTESWREHRDYSVACINIAVMLFLCGIILLVLIPSDGCRMPGAHEAALRATCQNNMKQMGIVAGMFAAKHPSGDFPIMSSEAGRLMMDADEIYPDILNDSYILVCPSHPDHRRLYENNDSIELIDDHSYLYLGYVVTNDAEVEAFAEVYRQRMAEGLPFDEDLEVAPGTGSGGGDSLIRLHQDNAQHLAERHESIDVVQWQSRIPILIEHPGNHTPEGGNVLYMDGSVEFIRYPGKWPMTTTTMNLLRTLAER